MQDLIDVAIVKAGEELLHVALVHDTRSRPTTRSNKYHHTHTDGFYLDLWNGEPHPRLISQPSQVMVHVLEDHVNAPFVLVVVDYQTKPQQVKQ